MMASIMVYDPPKSRAELDEITERAARDWAGGEDEASVWRHRYSILMHHYEQSVRRAEMLERRAKTH